MDAIKITLGLVASFAFGGISYFMLAKIPMHFSFYAFIIAVFAMVVISLMTKPTSEKVLNDRLTGWYIRK
jgi:SSS family solute:Na+ symporter